MTRLANRRPAAFVLGLFEIALAVGRALGREGIQVRGFERRPPPGSARPPGFRSRYMVGQTCPDPIRDPDELLRFLSREAERQPDRPILFFTDDVYIDFVARHRDALSSHFRFAFPPPDVADALLDKRKQFALAQRGGMPCPTTFFPESPRDVRAIRNELAYPVLIKPYLSHVWRERYQGAVIKGFRVDSAQELVARFDEVFATGLPVVVQTVMLGPATNHLKICAYVAKRGEILATYTGRKLRQNPPQFGNGTLCESAPVPEVAEIGLRFLDNIAYRGYANIEMMRDERDGALKFIELNGRPGLHHALLADAGVNFSLIEYLDVADLPRRPIGPQRYGLKWWSAPEDTKSFLAMRRAGELSLRAWIRSWIGARSFAVFAADDPIPALAWYGSRLHLAATRRIRSATAGRDEGAVRSASTPGGMARGAGGAHQTA